MRAPPNGRPPSFGSSRACSTVPQHRLHQKLTEIPLSHSEGESAGVRGHLADSIPRTPVQN
jgi:hypothetical protein